MRINMSGRHFTAICNHSLIILTEARSTLIEKLLQLLKPAYERNMSLLQRYDWYQPLDEWEEFNDPTHSQSRGWHVTIPPGFTATFGDKAIRFHIPIYYEQVKTDAEHFFALRSFFSVTSELLQSGPVLYAPCGREFRDELTDWVIDGNSVEDIEFKVANLYGLRACSVVPRPRTKKQVNYRRQEAFDRDYETVELYKDWFEDIRAAHPLDC